MSLLQGAATNSPINKSTLKTVISDSKQKRPENHDAILYITVDCVVSISLLLSIFFDQTEERGDP